MDVESQFQNHVGAHPNSNGYSTMRECNSILDVYSLSLWVGGENWECALKLKKINNYSNISSSSLYFWLIFHLILYWEIEIIKSILIWSKCKMSKTSSVSQKVIYLNILTKTIEQKIPQGLILKSYDIVRLAIYYSGYSLLDNAPN